MNDLLFLNMSRHNVFRVYNFLKEKQLNKLLNTMSFLSMKIFQFVGRQLILRVSKFYYKYYYLTS